MKATANKVQIVATVAANTITIKEKKLSKGKNKKIRRISKKPTPKGAKIACGNFVLKASKIEQQNSRNYFENSWQKQQQRIMSIGR